MAGDPKQLPPTVVSTLGLQCQLDKTLFERLSVSSNLEPPSNCKPLHACNGCCLLCTLARWQGCGNMQEERASALSALRRAVDLSRLSVCKWSKLSCLASVTRSVQHLRAITLGPHAAGQ